MPLFEGISYGGEKNAVIIDIGEAYTKCGFAGESSPRCIIPSEISQSKTKTVIKVYNCVENDNLKEVLVEFFQILYFRHLLVNPKERRVVVIESILCPTKFRNAVADVLFLHYEVPSVLFAPSHLVALFTLGIPSGLVLDAGFSEAFVLPVYEGIPILKAWEAIPLAGKAIHSHLENQLLEGAMVTTGHMKEVPLSSVVGALNEEILEDIKVRCCFVTELSRAKKIRESKLQEVGLQSTEESEIPVPPPDVNYPMDGNKVLQISGKVREETCEVLFERDNDERSVATLLLDAIVKSPVDMRRTLAENIVVMGGTAMLPGFLHRLMAELNDLLSKAHYSEALAIKSVKFHKTPCKENYTAWLGGAIFGALEVLPSRSVARETYLQTGQLADWSNLNSTVEAEKEEKSGLYAR